MKYQDTTEQIIEAFYTVYNTLGYGFLEKVYEEALVCEMAYVGLVVQQQEPLEIFYRGKKIGAYFADVLVNEIVIVEIKAAEALSLAHEAQLLNYLKATDIEVGLLLNFGPSRKSNEKSSIIDNKAQLLANQ